jgi:glucose-1-phosphate cytidylyltransferase
MKTVFFCGGLGMRLFPSTENFPKPLIKVGDHPIIWILMKYYSHYGYNEFILCLGYKGGEIKKFFLDYNEAISNDFILTEGGNVEVLSKDIEKWKITFADTGFNTLTGERLQKIEKFIGDDDWFMANYADALSDLNLQRLVDYAKKRDKIACFTTVHVPQSFHIVTSDGEGYVTKLERMEKSDTRINGGFFVFKKEIFKYIKKGEDIIEALIRLADQGELIEYKSDGFWASMDTYKDKARLDQFAETGKAPWEIWNQSIRLKE